MSSSISRRGGAAAIAAGVLLAIALIYSMLGDLEYQGSIAQNPMPDAIGMAAFTLGALATGLALWSLHALIGPTELTAKVGFAVAYAGAAFLLIPLWPATFLGPVLLAIGLALIGLARPPAGGFRSVGSTIHVMGFPAVVLVTPLLAALGIDGLVSFGLFSAVLSTGLIFIGTDMNARAHADRDPMGVAA
jgi:hypothetical protein